MKKILTIALIAALCLTSAFAVSFTGSAALELGYDLDSKDYGFVNNFGPKLVFGFELGSGEGGSAGEKDLRAEIAGTFTVAFKENTSKTAYTSDKQDFPKATITTLKITKANILYKDILTVGILDAGKSADYAKSYRVNDDGDSLSDQVASLSGTAAKEGEFITHAVYGFTAEAYGVKGGFGFQGNGSENSWHDVFAHAALTDKVLVENLKLSVGLAGEFFGVNLVGMPRQENYNTLQANAKIAYDNGDKIAASGAVDFALGLTSVENVDPKVGFEAAAVAKYDFAKLDFYIYSVDKFNNVILDTKLAASKTFAENYTVGGSFEINNATDDERNIGVDNIDVNGGKKEYTVAVNGKAVVDAFTFTADFSYGFEAKKIAVNGGVEYKNDYVSANVKAHFDKIIETDKSSVFYFTAGVSSDAVIDGATLALTYGKGVTDKLNLIDGQTASSVTSRKLGKVTASAKVSF